jgi:hypothetical protein
MEVMFRAAAFDFDAETLWTSRVPDNAPRRGVLSEGRYDAIHTTHSIKKSTRWRRAPMLSSARRTTTEMANASNCIVLRQVTAHDGARPFAGFSSSLRNNARRAPWHLQTNKHMAHSKAGGVHACRCGKRRFGVRGHGDGRR